MPTSSKISKEVLSYNLTYKLTCDAEVVLFYNLNSFISTEVFRPSTCRCDTYIKTYLHPLNI